VNFVSWSSLGRRIGLGCVLVGCVVAVGVQLARLQQQKMENDRLRALLQETQQQFEELRGESSRILQTRSRPVSDAEKQELLRLRNQSAQLKAATNEAQMLRSQLSQATVENQRLRAAQASVSAALSSPAAPADSFPKESWAFAGYATPEASFQSTLWAMSQGDSQTFLAGLAPEERARMEKSWRNKSAEQIGEEGRREMQKVSGFRILERRQIADDQVALTIFANGKGDTADMLLQRIGADWKFAGRTGRRQSVGE
jgi:hypothetical protein